MRSYRQHPLEYESLLDNRWDALEQEGEVGKIFDFVKNRALPMVRKGMLIGRILSMIHSPLPEPATPPSPPPQVTVDNRRRRSQPQSEFEMESAGEQSHPSMLMEQFARAAAQAESEAETEAFIGAMVPMVAKLVPRVASRILSATPHLVEGLAGAASLLRRNSATTPLVRLFPTVLRRMANSAANQVDAGYAVTPKTMTLNLARQMARVLDNPRLAALALRRSQLAERQYGGRTWI